MRYKFLRWLRDKIFRVPEATVPPKALTFIYYLLFPLNWFYENQSGLKYDFERHIYTINGIKFSGAIFYQLKQGSDKGIIFQVIKTGELITIRFIGSTQLDGKQVARLSIENLKSIT